MTPKEDIDALIDWLISEANEGKIDLHNHIVFDKDLRGMFRELHKMNCKNFVGGECLKGGRCDGNCRRMKNYDKTH